MTYNIKKIINIVFIIALLGMILGTSYLQLSRPELFIVSVASASPIPEYNLSKLKYNESIPPYLECGLVNYAQSCEYVNVPKDEPYITKTKWAWLYKNRQVFIVVMTIIGLCLNWKILLQWKRKLFPRTS